MAWVYHNKPPMGWPLDLSEPINDGLVGYWYMPEGSGTIIQDLSGNGNTGTINGNPQWVAGKYGPALDFDGTGDYVDTGVTSLLGTSLFCESTQQFSVIVSFNVASGNTGTLVAKAGSTGSNRTLQIWIDNDVLRIYLRGADNNVGLTVADGKNHMLVITWDGATGRCYFDGLFQGTLTVGAASEETTENIIFGARTGGTGFLLTGKEDFVTIYDRALIASEIALLYGFPFYGFLNPDEIPVLDQYYTVAVGTILPQITSAYMEVST